MYVLSQRLYFTTLKAVENNTIHTLVTRYNATATAAPHIIAGFIILFVSPTLGTTAGFT